MLKINIICVGKLKEKYWRDAIEEYAKRLSRFCKFSVTELNESRLNDSPSDKEIEKALENESLLMDKYLSAKGAYNIAMCIEGKLISSEDLADKISECGINGYSEINFIIGSSFGLCERIKSSANFKMSMSKMTFPHQLARVMLCEQIYRGFTISEGIKYHK